jgi:RNA polymerase sigma-70 factor, ECF subfamily
MAAVTEATAGEARGRRTSKQGGEGVEQTTSSLVSQAIRRAQGGDREALGFLYARYADNVCGYVRSIVHDQHEAEDITQQVFAKLIRVIGKYEERDVPFFAWILRVSRNVAVDHIRRQRAIPVEDVRTSEEPGQDRIGSERMKDLREALAEIPHDQREVLVLRHFAGLSPTEIAERTGRSEGSVHGLHHRGRRALTAELTRRGAAPSILRSPGGPGKAEIATEIAG